jgi:hypothetical protein
MDGPLPQMSKFLNNLRVEGGLSVEHDKRPS